MLQSKFPTRPSNVGENEVAEFITKAKRLQHVDSLRSLVQLSRREELRTLVKRFELEEKIKAGTVSFALQFITAGVASPEAKRTADATNEDRPGYVTISDIDALAPAIESYNSAAPAEARIVVPVPTSDRLIVDADDYRVAVAPIRAVDIISWPGIENRTLFNLNVRRQLPANKVRTALDRATTEPNQHDRFLGSHNGITVICRKFELSDADIVLHDPSVVNGAQSVIAFYDNRMQLTDQLRVFVKVCELDPAGPFARDIAIRSNTQSAVNNRNLRALDGPQLRLKSEVETMFPGVTYETRPDSSLELPGRVIHNHLVAKCLCAVMNRRPWFAIKSLSLFEEPHYTEIFHEEIRAEHVRLAVDLKQMIDEDREEYPEAYRRAWTLTSIVSTYLAGEGLRAVLDCGDLTAFAATYASNPQECAYHTDIARRSARKTLEVRRDQLQNEGRVDDFKVDFKNEQVLVELGKEVRRAAIYIMD